MEYFELPFKSAMLNAYDADHRAKRATSIAEATYFQTPPWLTAESSTCQCRGQGSPTAIDTEGTSIRDKRFVSDEELTLRTISFSLGIP